MEKTIGSEDEYLILASDGVWDVMSNEDVARFVVTALSNSTNVDGDFINIARHLCAEVTNLPNHSFIHSFIHTFIFTQILTYSLYAHLLTLRQCYLVLPIMLQH